MHSVLRRADVVDKHDECSASRDAVQSGLSWKTSSVETLVTSDRLTDRTVWPLTTAVESGSLVHSVRYSFFWIHTAFMLQMRKLTISLYVFKHSLTETWW